MSLRPDHHGMWLTTFVEGYLKSHTRDSYVTNQMLGVLASNLEQLVVDDQSLWRYLRALFKLLQSHNIAPDFGHGMLIHQTVMDSGLSHVPQDKLVKLALSPLSLMSLATMVETCVSEYWNKVKHDAGVPAYGSKFKKVI